jgi:hypothetical protein
VGARRGIEAPVEVSEGKGRVRFALPRGEWDVALVAKGYAPAFASNVTAGEPSLTLAPRGSSARPASRDGS